MNFYFEASKVLDKLDAKQGSIKSLITTVTDKDRKRTAALVIETLKYKSVLGDVIDAAELLSEKKITSRNLALLLVHDLLLSGGVQAGDGPIKQALLRHKTRLHSEFTRIKIKRGAKSNTELAQHDDSRAAQIPRYVRVNTLTWTTEEAIATFLSRGYTLSSPLESTKSFSKDPHIDNLLAFHPDSQFVDDPLYREGKIILQDKASCMPAYVLSPPPEDGARVIDATSAPGNKTSHLSALMRNKGQLFAFERDKRRFSTLNMMLARAQCSNIEPVNADFLTIAPSDPKYSGVTHILLDPSCSGSGIINRLDYLVGTDTEQDPQDERLNKLAAFQLSMIRHAMKFPSAKRIVYSTCSIHAAENEHVVSQALKSEEALNGRFVLAPRKDVIPLWQRRGLREEMSLPADAESLIRCSPGEDATNGFFVSLFVRQTPEEGSQQSSIDMSEDKKRKEMEDSVERAPKSKRRRKKKKSSNAE